MVHQRAGAREATYDDSATRAGAMLKGDHVGVKGACRGTRPSLRDALAAKEAAVLVAEAGRFCDGLETVMD